MTEFSLTLSFKKFFESSNIKNVMIFLHLLSPSKKYCSNALRYFAILPFVSLRYLVFNQTRLFVIYHQMNWMKSN